METSGTTRAGRFLAIHTTRLVFSYQRLGEKRRVFFFPPPSRKGEQIGSSPILKRESEDRQQSSRKLCKHKSDSSEEVINCVCVGGGQQSDGKEEIDNLVVSCSVVTVAKVCNPAGRRQPATHS